MVKTKETQNNLEKDIKDPQTNPKTITKKQDAPKATTSTKNKSVKKVEEKEKKVALVEKEYVIPLREKCRVVPRYKKANKAIKTIKEFLVRHMKIRDRDLKKIKIDSFLNEMIWSRGIRRPPHKIKVKVTKEGENVRVEPAQIFDRLKFKKARLEKREKRAIETMDKKKVLEKTETNKVKTEEKSTEEVTKKVNEKEKKAAVVEAGAKMEKAVAKQKKHEVGGKSKQPKRPIRVALNK